GRLGAGRLLRWLVATLTAVPKGLMFLSGHDIDIYSLQSILAVDRHNVFIPDFADAVGLELWVSWSDSGAPSLWIGFSKHHYSQGKIDADEDGAGAFAEGIKTTLGDAEPSPYELSAKFGEGNVVSLADLSRYSHLVLNGDL
ncbi:hypothetical protein FOZ63_018307, partial [Perkinsus olseni]